MWEQHRSTKVISLTKMAIRFSGIFARLPSQQLQPSYVVRSAFEGKDFALRIDSFWASFKYLTANRKWKRCFPCKIWQKNVQVYSPNVKFAIFSNSTSDFYKEFSCYNIAIFSTFSHRHKSKLQSTLVISKSKGFSEIFRDIRTTTYQICRIQEKKLLNSDISQLNILFGSWS